MTVKLNGVTLETPAAVLIKPAPMFPVCTPTVELVTVTLNVHEPLAGIVNDVEVPELFAPGTATVVTPTQVEVAAGIGAFTRTGRYVSVNGVAVSGVAFGLVTVSVPTDVPPTKMLLGANTNVVVGGESGVITIDAGCCASGGVPFAAIRVNGYVPVVVGVPEMTPVEALSVSPGGNDPPATLQVTAGVPVVVAVCVYGTPMKPFGGPTLVIAGATPGVKEKAHAVGTFTSEPATPQSCLVLLFPHTYTVPDAVAATLWNSPPAMCATFDSPGNSTGVAIVPPVVPLPTRPNELSPHPMTVPLLRSAKNV